MKKINDSNPGTPSGRRTFRFAMSCAIAFLLCPAGLWAQNPSYDAELATRLGADDYGMKKYLLVILKSGTNDTTDKVFIETCFRGHMSNMKTMVEMGKLVVAGPIGKNEKSYRGIFILNTSDKEEALKLLDMDPAVYNKLLEAELYDWYGSAALPEYLKASDKIWKKSH